jgi:hypothetical protein
MFFKIIFEDENYMILPKIIIKYFHYLIIKDIFLRDNS